MKRIKFSVQIGVLIGLLITASSCEQDFLNRKSLNAYSEEDVWSNLNLVQTFVNSKYRSLPHFYSSSRVVPSASGLSASSDEGYCQWNYESVWFFNLGQITPDNLSMDAWQGYYGFIRDCNTFFEHIDAVEGDEALKERLIGEMRFIRAWCYFDLISRYGGVPLITKVYSLSDDDYLVSRNSYDECMDFIIKELDEAAETLPVSYSGADIGRITKGAVLSLKSRALLYAASPLNNPANDRSKWLDAVDAAKAVVDLDAYTLYEGADYKQIFLEKFNPEVILSFNINATRNPSGSFESRLNVLIGPNGHHGWSAYTPSQSLVDQFPMKNGKMITEEGSGYDENNPYENRDPRFYADILYNGAEFRGRPYESFVGGLDSPQSPVENWNASLTGYNWRKYSNDALPIDENIGTDQNWIIFRYAEIYLNYAEAAYETGDEATARKYLNLVRSRTSVGMPDVTASGNELSEAIKLERQIELCFEGHRFFDVRRWKIAMETENRPLRGVTIEKKPSGGFSYSYFILQDRKFEERNYWYPIPKYEMDKNENLEQNPQY
ncbi:RagB/SusD family nutrient uptake outer membrane protein [Parapedobacter defluvii]|nr:RagB/SusD family nutrient uptake outer membrane protein [Parapedobacter defluvii]